MSKVFNKKLIYKTSSELLLHKYNDNYYTLVLMKHLHRDRKAKKVINNITDDRDYKLEAIARSKRTIKEIVLCNDFMYFFTLTFSADKLDRFNLELLTEKLKVQFRKIKRKNKDFHYIVIAEKHQDGAYHFHGLCNEIDKLSKNEYGYLHNPVFLDLFGFNSFIKLYGNKDKVASYISSYITTNPVFLGSSLYFCSRGLQRKEKIDLTDLYQDYNSKNGAILLPPNCDFENDFVRLYNLNKKEVDKITNILYNISRKGKENV